MKTVTVKTTTYNPLTESSIDLVVDAQNMKVKIAHIGVAGLYGKFQSIKDDSKGEYIKRDGKKIYISSFRLFN